VLFFKDGCLILFILFSLTGLSVMESSVEIRRAKLLLKLFAIIIFCMTLCIDRHFVHGNSRVHRLSHTTTQPSRPPWVDLLSSGAGYTATEGRNGRTGVRTPSSSVKLCTWIWVKSILRCSENCFNYDTSACNKYFGLWTNLPQTHRALPLDLTGVELPDGVHLISLFYSISKC